MDVPHLIEAFELEASGLDVLLRSQPLLRPLFTRNFLGVDLDAVRRCYLQLLKRSVDYVQYTVPALRAAGRVLRSGDAKDRSWSALFLGYAEDEIDDGEAGEYGHHVWAREDMQALGAAAELLAAPAHPSAVVYGKFFVDDAAHHPYAILGAKGVLEHLAIRAGDDLARGMTASRIPNAASATRFFQAHGVLDIQHVREGDHNLQRLEHPDKRRQIIAGAYLTSGTYRALVHDLPAA